jgi:hypothetical protein
MEPDSSEPNTSKLSNQDLKKLLDDREKAKSYIKNCKEIIAKQSEQLKAQQASFKESLSSLETQQYNSRFHAVGIKLELETHKVYMIFYKKYRLLTALGFYKFKFNPFAKPPVRKFVPIELKACLRSLCNALKLNHSAALRHGMRRIKNLVIENGEKAAQEIGRLEKENKELKFRIAKAKLKTESSPVLQEMIEENKSLKEKIKNSEDSVELFIKEMSNLLDKHEPPGFREEIERLAQKNKKGKITSKSKSKNSPERNDYMRKSLERKLNCD